MHSGDPHRANSLTCWRRPRRSSHADRARRAGLSQLIVGSVRLKKAATPRGKPRRAQGGYAPERGLSRGGRQGGQNLTRQDGDPARAGGLDEGDLVNEARRSPATSKAHGRKDAGNQMIGLSRKRNCPDGPSAPHAW